MELLARIEAVARDAPARPAFIGTDGVVTYGELVERVVAVRSAILTHAGSGKTVLLNLGNITGFAAMFLGTLSAGANALLVPASASAAEVSALAARTSASLIVTQHERSAIAHCAPVMPIDAIRIERERCPASSRPGDLLLATSGSTSQPKIVCRTAASLDAVAANMVEAIGFDRDDRILAVVPLAHSYGIEHELLAPLWAGATVLLCDGLDIGAIRAAATRGVTLFPAVPTVLERLADLGETLPGLSGVRAIYSAGAPLPDAVRDRYIAQYGTPVGQLYGSTEIGTVTYRPGDRHAGVGLPMRGVSIRILDSGEVAVRSPSMFAGYFDSPAPLVDGHFVTGDLGHLAEDGSLVLTGRSTMLVDIGGIKVNPLEVENVLCLHPDVAACAVVPLRQSETVFRLRAVVVPRDLSRPPSTESLRDFARARLAVHKIPRVFETRAELPRSATGKVLRHMLGAP